MFLLYALYMYYGTIIIIIISWPSRQLLSARIVSYRMEIRYRVNDDRCGLLPTNLTAPGGSVTSDDRHQSNNKSVVVADLDVWWLNTASEV